MNYLPILAQTSSAGESAPEGTFIPVSHIWEQITSLNPVAALTFICFGVVCLLYGWRVFKILVILSFALAGLVAGYIINEYLIEGNAVWLGIIGMVLMVIVSIPLMRWGVSALGAAAGGILAGGAWYAFELPEKYILAGVLVGVIAGGMISFIIFKIAVMLFTSFGGSVLIVVGILAIIYNRMGEDAQGQIQDLVLNHNWFVPVALIVPTAIGIFIQNKFIKGSPSWSV
jgi:hypothetical protein